MSSQPQRLDAGPHVVAYSITVQAPAEEIYTLLADPHRHHEIDGSGTVGTQAFGPHQLRQGDTFSVRMKKFGIRYRLPLKVTRAEPPASGRTGVVEWRQPTGHRWRWEFQSADGGATTVTEAFDASQQNRAVRAVLRRVGVLRENARSIQGSLARVKERFENSE